jgi:VanZ family protein
LYERHHAAASLPIMEEESWRHRTSPLARLGWLACLVLIVYASLTPWVGWRDMGVSPWAFLVAAPPRFVSRFDVVVNVLGYVPFGALTVAALHPRFRGTPAVLIAMAAALVLSVSIEALQTFLPRRISSNIDLATNLTGALIGAVAMAPAAEALIDRGRLVQLRSYWFARDAAVGLVLLVLWPIAQVHAGRMLFGNGQLDVAAPLRRQIGALGESLGIGAFGPVEFAVAEAFVTATGLLAVGLVLVALMTPNAPRGRLVAALIAAALAAKTLAYGVRFGPDHAFAWVTPGAIGGVLLGSLALLAAASGAPAALLRMALVVLAVKLVVINLVPAFPYPAGWLRTLYPGRYLNMHAAFDWVSTAWPYALLAWLCAQVVYARRSRVAARI